MKIVQAPLQVLSQKAKPVSKIDSSIKQLIKDMEITLNNARNPEGVGLAAPQVGKSLRLFIVKQTPRSPFMTFINPVIESTFDKQKEEKSAKGRSASGGDKGGVQLEGCLSLKDIWGVVKRHHGVVVSYQDEQGVSHKRTFDGFISTIIQHEVDHLGGKLFTLRVLEQGNPLYKSRENAKGETEFEELEI